MNCELRRIKNGETAQTTEKRFVLNNVSGFSLREPLTRCDTIKRLHMLVMVWWRVCMCMCQTLFAALCMYVYVHMLEAISKLYWCAATRISGMYAAFVSGTRERHRSVSYLLLFTLVCVQVSSLLCALIILFACDCRTRVVPESTAHRTQKQVNLFEFRFRFFLSLRFVSLKFSFGSALVCSLYARVYACMRVCPLCSSVDIGSTNEQQGIHASARIVTVWCAP